MFIIRYILNALSVQSYNFFAIFLYICAKITHYMSIYNKMYGMKKLLLLFSLLTIWVQTNAQTFEEYKDQRVNRVGCEPMRAWFVPFATAMDARYLEAEQSTNYQSLNGKWKLYWVADDDQRPTDFFRPDFDDSRWKEEPVPCNVEVLGYGEPIYTNVAYPHPMTAPTIERQNPVTSYRKTFTVPDGWKGQKVTLHFQGVQSCLYLWINGKYVGFHEDSMSDAEFDLTPYLQDGKNLLAAQVMRWSDGSYLEDQDMWRMSGIFRDVYLMAEPMVHVSDLTVKTELKNNYKNGVLNLSYSILNSGKEISQLKAARYTLYSPNGVVVNQVEQPLDKLRLQPGKEAKYTFTWAPDAPVQLWSAEQPYLYRLVITLVDKKGRETESIRQEVGFRDVRIEDGIFKVNGKKVYIRGTNYHDTNPLAGRYVPLDLHERDLKMMKQFNINAIRCSHYPRTPRFYELCNRLGFYVWDEANNESHGAGTEKGNRMTAFEDWLQPMMERCMAMIERDKNQPCVVVWSMGNECHGRGKDGHSNFDVIADSIRRLDPTRPIHYENQGTDFDIIANMYITQQQLLDDYPRWPKKPVILCEYEHAMGNSGGGMQRYWDIFYSHERMQGGFIWDWVDQGIQVTREGKTFFANGWDFSKDEPTDGDFCFNGLVSPDRQPHGELWEVKKAHEPALFEAEDLSKLRIRIKNVLSFTNLSQYECQWELMSSDDSKGSASGFIPLDIAPLSEQTMQIPGAEKLLQKMDTTKHEYFLNLTLRLRQNQPWAEKDHVVARHQFHLGKHELEFFPASTTLPKDYKITEQDQIIRIPTQGGSYAIDRRTGTLCSINMRGQEMLTAPARPNFARPATCNEREHFSRWEKAGLWLAQPEVKSVKVIPGNTNPVYVESRLLIPGRVEILVRYAIYYENQIKIETILNPYEDTYVGKIGWQFYLKPEMQNVQWMGNDLETYRDRNMAGFVCVNYNKKVDDLQMPYEVPQENGNRHNTRFVSVKADTLGLIAQMQEPMDFSIRNWSDEQMHAQPHLAYLQKEDHVTLNLDYQNQGVGQSPGRADVLEPYRVTLKNVSYTLYLCPEMGGHAFCNIPWRKSGNEAPFNPTLTEWDVTTQIPIGKPIQLRNRMTGKLLTVKDDNTLTHQDATPGASQTLRLEKTGKHTVKVVDVKSGRVLSVQQGKESNGSNVVMEPDRNETSQQWKLTESDTNCLILTNVATKRSMDMHVSEARVVLWDTNGGNNQQWEVKE